MKSNRSDLKKAILDKLSEHAMLNKTWEGLTAEALAPLVGERVSRVASCLEELAAIGSLVREKERYSLNEATLMRISKEVRLKEWARLDSLNSDELSQDNPDYLKKAVRDAIKKTAQHLPSTIINISFDVQPNAQVQFVAASRDAKLMQGTEDFSAEIGTLNYHQLVDHIAERIHKGLVG